MSIETMPLETEKENVPEGKDADATIIPDRRAPESAIEQEVPTVTPRKAERQTSEYIERPVFGREAIKSKDIKAIQEQLKQLAEKQDERSTFDLARQLAYLKQAGIKLSDRGKDYYSQKLGERGEAMRERGAKAVAQYHVYLKYVGLEDKLADEDRKIISDGCQMGSLGNRRQLATLAMNAKYLGVLDNVEAIEDDLRADLLGQLKDHVSADRVAAEVARRKYLGVERGLPDEYGEYHKLIEGKLGSYEQGELWDKYARLKLRVDYVRRVEPVDEVKQEKMASHVEKMAEIARVESKRWLQYSAYIADARHLSGNYEKHKGRDMSGVEAEEEVIMMEGQIDQEKETVASKQNEEVEGTTEMESDEKIVKAKVVVEDEGVERTIEVNSNEQMSVRAVAVDEKSKNVEEEPSSQRARFEAVKKKFYEEEERRRPVWSHDKDILKRGMGDLKSREKDLVWRRWKLSEVSSEGNENTAWANEAMKKLRAGADFSEVMNEEYLMKQLEVHKVSGSAREARRQRYIEIMRNEFGVAQMMEKPTVMDKVGSLWIEKMYARWNVAKGLSKFQAVVPWGKRKQREVIRARQDTVKTMYEAADDDKVDGKVRELLRQLAIEYDLMNVRDVKQMRRREWAAEEDSEKTREIIENTVADIEAKEVERAAQSKGSEGGKDEDENKENTWVDYV